MTAQADEINARVARILGYRRPSEVGRCDVCGWPLEAFPERGCVADNCSMRPAPERRADAFRAFSTDYAALPEMLAWLRNGEHWHIWIEQEPDGYSAHHRIGDLADQYMRYQFQHAYGDTLPEAVARLVVAVHAREAEERGTTT